MFIDLVCRYQLTKYVASLENITFISSTAEVDTSVSRNSGHSGVMTPSNLDAARAVQKYSPQNRYISSKDGFSIDHLKCQDCSVDF